MGSYGQTLGGCCGDHLEWETNKLFDSSPLLSYNVLLFKKMEYLSIHVYIWLFTFICIYSNYKRKAKILKLLALFTLNFT
jgi:hypothetical protein